MSNFWRTLVPGLLVATLVTPCAFAQDEAEAEAQDQEVVEDVIVVTASRTEQRLQEVPVAMTVISAEELANTPADDYGDVLRAVPGLNVSQISARDVQIAGRSATGSLSTSQLVLLDGRSVYLDFFGFVMWDLLPVDFREISQIEVVRGPGSAVWGANALGGVVNLITKSPWEMVGTSVTVGGGELGSLNASISHAGAGETSGYKVSAAYSEQDPYDRPSGVIPGSSPPTPYPDFANEGTKQPKIDLRYDKNLGDGDSILTANVGWAETDGIVHTGIGPFNISSGTNFKYAKVSWAKNTFVLNFYANLLDGSAPNLLTVGVDGNPLVFDFLTDTYNLDFSNSHQMQGHTITYGGNVRQIDFDLSIAPGEDERQELGVFIQDEIELSDKVTWLVGARWDDIDPVGSVVSPRTSLLISPKPDHNFRISYNKAFRAPSLVENYLDTAIVNGLDLGPILTPILGVPLPSIPYFFPTATLGNPQLGEETLTAYEVGYVGSLANNKVTLTLALYRNELEDATDFYQAVSYGPGNYPVGWPPFPLNVTLPGPVLDGILVGLDLPAVFSYRNTGERIDEGLEFSLDYRPNSSWHWNFNYSYQAEPEVTGILLSETNQSPEHRLNTGIGYTAEKWYVDANVNYVDEAYWTDVLDSRFWGTTDDYTIVNLGVGYHINDNVTVSVMGNNIFDEDVQQHIFGDVISRIISGQVRFTF